MSAKTTPNPPKLLTQIRREMRVRHMSLATEKSYVSWARRFILFSGKRHPKDLAEPEVNKFLNYLANERHVSASTQTQALCAILFLYRHVLGRELGELQGLVRAKKRRRLPVVLTPDQVRSMLSFTDGTPKLILTLLYGSGLRLAEGLRLRVKDIDFVRHEITVRQGKGGKDRRTVLPKKLVTSLKRQMTEARQIHEKDLRDGHGRVFLPKIAGTSTTYGPNPCLGEGARRNILLARRSGDKR